MDCWASGQRHGTQGSLALPERPRGLCCSLDAHRSAQVKALQGTVVGLEDQLAQSSSSNAALSQQASGLRSELADVRKALGATQVRG